MRQTQDLAIAPRFIVDALFGRSTLHMLSDAQLSYLDSIFHQAQENITKARIENSKRRLK